ncbi:ATP-binding protein [Kribbella sp. NPDC051586]|uniref:ATP-binding protein n=1 Tax=Kribbella sp. NPDC051586 TaxID=3364118 RepID=UPI0037B99B6B
MAGETVRSGSPERTGTILSPGLIDRSRELTALVAALGRPPALVLVEGEAGIGKSRLLHEALTRECRPNAVAACPPFREPYTLGPVVDALRQATSDITGLGLSALAGALRPLFPEWAADLPPMPDAAEDATAARHRLFRALVELLERLGLTVLVLEDLHWADDATVEFVLYLVSRQPASLSLILTYRPEDLPEGSLVPRLSSRAARGWTQVRITLAALDVGGTAELVSSMVGGESVSAEFASFLHDRTEGVPLVVEEVVRLMHARSDLSRRAGSWVRRHLVDIDVPPTVRDAVLERAGRLDEDARVVLRAAAVIGGPVDERTLLAIAALPPDRWTAALTAALGSRLLHEDDGRLIAYRHILACRAVYEAIPAPERRALHLLVGRALECRAPQPVNQLARHYREAGLTELWCRYAESAADLALASGDESAAVVLLYDLVTTADLSARALIRLASKIPFGSMTGDDRLGELVRVLRAMLDTAGPTRAEQGEIRNLLGRVLVLMEEHDAARIEIERAIPDLTHAPALAARAMTLLGLPRGSSWTAAQHQHWLRRAAATTADSMEPVDQEKFLVDRVTGLLMLGSEAGWAEVDRMLSDGSLGHHAQTTTAFHLNVGDLSMMWGRYGDARRRLDCALELAEQHDYRRLRDLVLVTRTTLDWLTGAWSGLAERVDALLAESDIQSPCRLEATLVRGLLLSATGDRARAKDDLHAVLRETRRRGAVSTSMTPAAELARLALREDDVVTALELTEEPIDVIMRKRIWVWAADIAPMRIQALVNAGRFDEAARTVDAFALGLRRRRAPASAAALLVCRGMLAEGLAEHGRAAALFGRSADVWRTLPRPYDALLAEQRHARCLLALGEEPALAALSKAFDELSGLGAGHAADIVQRILRDHGVATRKPGRGGRPSYGDQLSPRELDVVALVVDGLTNRQIADALVLSTQTVASHLHSAMRKLQVSSRTALAVSVVERGVIAGRGGTADRQR